MADNFQLKRIIAFLSNKCSDARANQKLSPGSPESELKHSHSLHSDMNLKGHFCSSSKPLPFAAHCHLSYQSSRKKEIMRRKAKSKAVFEFGILLPHEFRRVIKGVPGNFCALCE